MWTFAPDSRITDGTFTKSLTLPDGTVLASN
jgi:hypothetical protein